MHLARLYSPASLGRLLAVGLAIWAWSALAEDARAACGDYVLLGHGHHSSPESPGTMFGGHEPNIPERPTGPCHGAQCGQQVPSTPSAPPAVERGVDHWARLAERMPVESRNSFAASSNSSVRPLAGYPCSIEHPPKGAVC